LPSELFESIKIPRERIAVLIGKNGKVKRKIEKLGEAVVEVDSKTGIVDVEGKGNPANFYDAVSAVKAIGRGFSPENAFLLFGENVILDLVDVQEMLGGGEKNLQTKRGRVIGRSGFARKAIEKSTGAKISVFGKTVSVIGSPEAVETARKAIEMLLDGAQHQTVMNFLKRSEEEGEKFSL
jgi:ribosomal RNA assembly protein